MDGIIPFIFKALKKKKAMKYYLSLSSSSQAAQLDVAELARQDLFMTPQHRRASGWHEGDHEPALTAMTPLRGRPKGSDVQQLAAAMQALPREAFSPRRRTATPTAGWGSGRSNLGVK